MNSFDPDTWPEGWDAEPDEPDDFTEPPYAAIPVSAPPANPELPDDEQEGVTKVLLRQASTIRMRGVKWVYQGRIPLGMVTLLAGREGIGKSTVLLDIAARLTRGTLEGRYVGRPKSVIICATEDSWSHTIVPRLKAVDADMDLVFHVSVQDEDGNVRAISTPRDTARLQRVFLVQEPALMIIDPLLAILDGKIDTHKQAEVQQALEPMVKMCERVGMSILALVHVNKSGGTDPLNSIMGSKAFTTLPRSILYCIEEEEDSYLFCHVKCNVGPKMPSVRYRLQSVRFDIPPDEVEEGDEPFIESSRIVWGEVEERSAQDVLQEAQEVTRLGSASAEILAMINAAPATVTAAEIKIKLNHLSDRQIENACSRMARGGKIERLAKGVYRSVGRLPNSVSREE